MYMHVVLMTVGGLPLVGTRDSGRRAFLVALVLVCRLGWVGIVLNESLDGLLM